MPSPSTSPVTLPNRVSTPTFPVGIDVVLEKSRINSRIATTMRRKRFLNPEKFGMARSEPPKSKSPRPVVVMLFLRPKLGRTECFQVATIILCCSEERNFGGAGKARQTSNNLMWNRLVSRQYGVVFDSTSSFVFVLVSRTSNCAGDSPCTTSLSRALQLQPRMLTGE